MFEAHGALLKLSAGKLEQVQCHIFVGGIDSWLRMHLCMRAEAATGAMPDSPICRFGQRAKPYTRVRFYICIYIYIYIFLL